MFEEPRDEEDYQRYRDRRLRQQAFRHRYHQESLGSPGPPLAPVFTYILLMILWWLAIGYWAGFIWASETFQGVIGLVLSIPAALLTNRRLWHRQRR